MERLAEALALPPDCCSFICLPGHSPGEGVERLTADQWLESFATQYRQAADGHPNIIFLGYSLGGLLMMHLLANGSLPAPKRQVLFAPALAFRPWTKIPTYLPRTLLDHLLIPSFTPRRYKAHPGVTIGAYQVLFEISRQLNQQEASAYNIPTLVLCDQRDELVHPEGLRRFIREKQLSQWELHIAPSTRWERWGKKHLLVAKEYQSEAYWHQMKERIDTFLHA